MKMSKLFSWNSYLIFNDSKENVMYKMNRVGRANPYLYKCYPGK